MPLEAVWELSLGWYSDRLDHDYRPPSLEHLQTLLAEVGLTGEFWQLSPSG